MRYLRKDKEYYYALFNFLFQLIMKASPLFLFWAIVTLPLIGDRYKIGFVRFPELFAFLFIISIGFQTKWRMIFAPPKYALFFFLFLAISLMSFLINYFNFSYPTYLDGFYWTKGIYLPVFYNFLMFFRFTLCFLFFLSLITYLRANRVKIVQVLRVYVLTATMTSVIGISQFMLFFVGVKSGVYFRAWSLSPQILGTANEPGPFAGYLITSLILSLIAYNENNFFSKKINAIFILLQLLALILTFSSAGWIIFFIILLSYIFFKSIKSIASMLKLIAWVVFIIIAFVGLSYFIINTTKLNILPRAQFVFSRVPSIIFMEPKDLTEGGRVSGKYICLNMFRESPVIGIGLGNFPFFRNEYLYPQKIPFTPDFDSPLNVYAEILAESGFMGFVFFSFFVISIIRKVVVAYPYIAYAEKKCLLAVGFPVIGIMINFFFSSILSILYVWFLPAVMLAIASKPLETKN